MTQVQGIPYRRHGPTAALREFLDPLDPGDYFDCGRARLHGLDDALLDEARSRGRTIGDDAFLLVATDMGLIYCRPSISFAIAARWEDVTLIRPRGDDPVVLPVTWPRHGELKFTVSKRLAGNIFRRWLQLRMHAARRARQAAAESGRHRLGSLGVAGVDTGRTPAVEPTPLPDRRAGRVLDGDLAAGVDLDADVDLDTDVDLDADPITLGGAGGDSRAENASVGRDESTPADPALVLAAARADGTGDEKGGDTDEGNALDLFIDDWAEDRLDEAEPVAAPATTGGIVLENLADEDLARVSIPLTDNTPASWVGSAVSLVASLVVLSTLVLIAAVSISLYRGAIGGSEVAATGDGTDPATVETAGVDETVVDHERFRPTTSTESAAAADPAVDTSVDVGSGAPAEAGEQAAGPTTSSPDEGLSASAPGGASLAEPGSRQQLLAVPPADEGPLQARRCSSNYGGCVPDVEDLDGADVDCAGRGDGPYFAEGEVVVLGPDLYGLDTDGDGIACEADQPDRAPIEAERTP